MIQDVLPPVVLVATFPALGVPSKEGLRVPDAWMRVDVGLAGIKSIYIIALGRLWKTKPIRAKIPV